MQRGADGRDRDVTGAHMHDEQGLGHTNDAQPTLPAGGGAEGTGAWRRIAQIPVHEGGQEGGLGDAIAASLPTGLTSAAQRSAIEQAVLAALARRASQTGRLPHAVVVSQHANGAGVPRARSGCGWSFFVVERPAPPSQDAGETVELFLYCDG